MSEADLRDKWRYLTNTDFGPNTGSKENRNTEPGLEFSPTSDLEVDITRLSSRIEKLSGKEKEEAKKKLTRLLEKLNNGSNGGKRKTNKTNKKKKHNRTIRNRKGKK